MTPPEQSAETDAVEDDGPECDLCGKTDCPDADLPEFSEPRGCQYRLAYEALRYDRCEYGCGRDVTKQSIREALAVLILPPAQARTDGHWCLTCASHQCDHAHATYPCDDPACPADGCTNPPASTPDGERP